ncbi:MAG: PASTA domain-containing protein, partial [Actinomycetota bacterium]|nr:PASTA domain-containing protein [Actinomycetota bacterium]
YRAMKPIATDFGPIAMPPTDPRYVEGGSGSEVPSVTGLKLDAARKKLEDAGFQVAPEPTPVNSSSRKGTVVGTTPKGKTIPGSIITINTSTGIAPAPVYQPPPPSAPPPPPPPDAPPPPPPQNVLEIPGLPPIVLPWPAPPPPPPPPPAPPPA